MTPPEAVAFIQPALVSMKGTWADIGAGTGVFTIALMELLVEGKVIAVDKSPHALYQLRPSAKLPLEIEEADFTRPLALPPLDGVLMANALHYAPDPVIALQHCIEHLKPGGTFLLIEYDTSTPNFPWVPYPVPLNVFDSLCKKSNLHPPRVVNRKKSIYNDGDLYLATTTKK